MILFLYTWWITWRRDFAHGGKTSWIFQCRIVNMHCECPEDKTNPSWSCFQLHWQLFPCPSHMLKYHMLIWTEDINQIYSEGVRLIYEIKLILQLSWCNILKYMIGVSICLYIQHLDIHCNNISYFELTGNKIISSLLWETHLSLLQSKVIQKHYLFIAGYHIFLCISRFLIW